MGRFILSIMGFAMLVAYCAPSRNSHASTDNSNSVARDWGSDTRIAHGGSGASSTGSQQQASYGEIRLDRGSSGQFHVDAAVNGQSIPFLIDTGADLVAITIDDARRLGLNIDPSQFQPVGTGAGGALQGQPVMINELSIGGRSLTNVQAVVIDGLGTNLLGQSVLREFGKVELSGDTMVIST